MTRAMTRRTLCATPTTSPCSRAPTRRVQRKSASLFESRRVRSVDRMLRGLILRAAIFLIATFPATWLLMLFLGNTGLDLSYWGTLPLGILVSALLGTAGAQWDYS